MSIVYTPDPSLTPEQRAAALELHAAILADERDAEADAWDADLPELGDPNDWAHDDVTAISVNGGRAAEPAIDKSMVALLTKYNEHHDAHGRFAEGDGDHDNSAADRVLAGMPDRAQVDIEGAGISMIGKAIGRANLTHRDLLGMSGAPDADGYTVSAQVVTTQGPPFLSLIATGPDIKWCARHVKLSEPDVMHNDTLRLEPKAPPGAGTKFLAREVDTLSKIGFKEITTEAAYSEERDVRMNGYYTWARLGYDGKPRWRPGTPRSGPAAALVKAQKVSDLVKTPAGRSFWKDHGDSFTGTFTLAKDSLSRRTLDAYMKDKGYKL